MSEATATFHAQRQADDAVAMDVAERHRQMIDRWFYPCSPRMHAALADLYEMDQRFAHNIDRYAAGLTPFWSAAIRANAARLSADRPGARADDRFVAVVTLCLQFS